MTTAITLAQPKHIISLASSAVLVSIETHIWSATKQDREISEEVTSAKKADKDAGRFVKQLLANKAQRISVEWGAVHRANYFAPCVHGEIPGHGGRVLQAGR